jgi:glucose/arabinose dehydrogenase
MRLRYLILAGAVFVLAACRAPAVIQTPAQPSLTQPSAQTENAPTLSPPVEVSTANVPETPPTLTLEPADTPTAASTPTPERPADAAALPDPAGYEWQPVLQGLTAPVFVTGAGDGSGRLFVVQQSGQIMVTRDGVLSGAPFLEISDRTSLPRSGTSYGERGLLGLAFHPQYAENGYFYVNYTDRNGDTNISRFQVRLDDPDQADPASEKRLLFVSQPFANHNGGMLEFGPDGYLYIGLGDGGSGGDPQGNAQSNQTLLGKLLRIDVNSGDPYTVPADNPFANGGGLPEIWSNGLRNPWRFAFDRLTSDLYVADVGQNQWEEVSFLPAGSPGAANFGWDYYEATHAYEGQPPQDVQIVQPVAEYDHGQGCSITGGYVYRGLNLPAWQGVYLYGDYCSGLVWGLLRGAEGAWQHELLFQTGMNITSFGLDEAGELYLADFSSGAIYRLAQK